MKTFLRVLVVSLFLTTLGVISGFAQDETSCPDLETCFAKYRELRKADCGKQDEAVKYGKYIFEKWKDDELNKELVAKIKDDSDKIEKSNAICKRNTAYNEAFKAKNWDTFFKVGKEIINEPTTDKGLALDVMLDLASVGLITAAEKNDKFNNDSMMYAKTAMQSIASGVTSKTGKWGVWIESANKDNALSWMNYTIGWIMYYRQGETMAEKKNEAIPYFYKATQMGDKKSDTSLYIRIGYWYGEKATALFDEFTKIRESADKAETEETKTKLNDEAKTKLALARGYAERAMDAFARAHKVATAEKVALDQKLAAAEKEKPVKPEAVKAASELVKAKADLITGLNSEVTKFYKFRFNGKAEGQTEYVSALISKPMPDPSTAVMPVAEDPTPTTTTTGSTTTPTKTEVKPATETTVKSNSTDGTTTTTKATTKATTPTKSKTPVKKPVTKKKGTR